MAPLLCSFLSALMMLHTALAQWWPIDQLCNTTFIDKVNGSGTVTFNPGINTAQERNGSFDDPNDRPTKFPISDPTWLVAVQDPGDHLSAQVSMWYSTGGEDYWNDTQTKFDACAFLFQLVPNNTAFLSVDDPGDCSVMLTPECRSALLTSVVSTANLLQRHATSPPSSNLSAGVLPNICEAIANRLNPLNPDKKSHLPKVCWNDFDAGSGIDPFMEVLPLTGNNRSISYPSGIAAVQDNSGGLNYSCPTLGDNGQKFWNTGFVTTQIYSMAMQQAWPILSVLFQVANEEAVPVDLKLIEPSARLSCPRVRTISKGSRTPAPLPAGTPTSHHIPGSGVHLTNAATAGIVTGCVISSLLVFVLVWNRLENRSARRRDYAARHGKPEIVADEMNALSRHTSEVHVVHADVHRL